MDGTHDDKQTDDVKMEAARTLLDEGPATQTHADVPLQPDALSPSEADAAASEPELVPSRSGRALRVLGAAAVVGTGLWLKYQEEKRRKDRDERRSAPAARSSHAPLSAAGVPRPSAPLVSPRVLSTQHSVPELYASGRTALERGDLTAATASFEQIASLYDERSYNPSVASPELAASLYQLARLAASAGDEVRARGRFMQSARTFEALSGAAAAAGDAPMATMAAQYSEDARQCAAALQTAMPMASPTSRPSRREQQLEEMRHLDREADQYKLDWARSLGRI
jgi:hypothetical protein